MQAPCRSTSYSKPPPLEEVHPTFPRCGTMAPWWACAIGSARRLQVGSGHHFTPSEGRYVALLGGIVQCTCPMVLAMAVRTMGSVHHHHRARKPACHHRDAHPHPGPRAQSQRRRQWARPVRATWTLAALPRSLFLIPLLLVIEIALVRLLQLPSSPESALLGAILAISLLGHLRQLHPRQTDFRHAGIAFSIVFLPTAFLMCYGAAFTLLRGGTSTAVLDFLSAWGAASWNDAVWIWETLTSKLR